MVTFKTDVVNSDAPISDDRSHLLLNISCYFSLLLQQFLEGEDGNSVFDDTTADLHECCFEVVHPKIVEMWLVNVIVDAGIHRDGDIIFIDKTIPRVMSR